MLKKITGTISIISIILLLSACSNTKEEKVQLEVYNPVTGELIKENEIVTVTFTGEPIHFKIKVKDEGQYLSEADTEGYVSEYVNHEKTNLAQEIGQYKIELNYNQRVSQTFYLIIKDYDNLKEYINNEINTMPYEFNEYKFIPSASGKYIIETLGETPNYLIFDNHEATNKGDGINKSIELDLDENKTYMVKTGVLDDTEFGHYSIVIRYLPDSVELNHTQIVNLPAHKNVYLLFTAEESAKYYITISHIKSSEIRFYLTANAHYSTCSCILESPVIIEHMQIYTDTINDSFSGSGYYYLHFYNSSDEDEDVNVYITK